MGAMIMLLVLVAWDVREQMENPLPMAIQSLTLEEAEELREKLKISIEDADFDAENAALFRKQAHEALAELQAKLALAEKETQKIRDELVRLEQLTRQLDSQTQATPEEVEQLKRLLAQLQQQKAEAELELAELQKEAAQKEKSYAIVPRQAQNGTFRRPIYIECRNDKIIIQPEGIELVPSDFMASDRPDNPFDTVLRVIRQYYMETGQIVRGSEPYPLMIVRPSGVEMYESALHATRDWVKDFGYEIVNEDWNIQYPEPNEELRDRIRQQLAVSRDRLNGYVMAMQRASTASGYGNMPQQYRVTHQGDVVPTGRGTQTSEYMQNQLAAMRRGGEPPTVAAVHGARSVNQEETLPTATENSMNERTTGAAGVKPPVENGSKEMPPTAPDHVVRQNPSQPTNQPPNGEMTNQQTPLSIQRPPQNMQQRQQNWALQGVTQYSSGISRGVKIRCEADRFVLSAQTGLQKQRVIPIENSVSAAADQLVKAIWEFQESWGTAGENRHWKPILQVQVPAGGEQRLRELKIHLRYSGLVIEE
jgi:hypothetical protein